MQASEFANQLRALADALDKAPEADIHTYCSIEPRQQDKETFVELAKVLPRPLTKEIRYPGTSYEDFVLKGAGFFLAIPRAKMCVLVEPAHPAKYECPSIFSEDEEAALVEGKQ